MEYSAVFHGCRNSNFQSKNVLFSLFLLKTLIVGPQGFGDLGEGLFIFSELGSTADYFRGTGEQAHTFGDLGSTAKK